MYLRTRFSARSQHTLDAIDILARPFSTVRAELRPLLLLAMGMLMAGALSLVDADAHGASPFEGSAPTAILFHFILSALAGWTNVLMVVHSFALLLIIGSWVSMFTASQPIAFFCREWLDFLMGPLRRYPIVIGTFNIMPLIFMFAIGAVHRLLLSILYTSYLAT